MRRPNGFTLIEVMVALVLLGFVLLGVQAAITDRMVRDVGGQEKRARAAQLAMDRIHAVQADPGYYTLAARYAGTETALDGAPGFERTTALSITTLSAGRQFTTVTVTVSAPGVPRPAARTVIVASP